VQIRLGRRGWRPAPRELELGVPDFWAVLTTIGVFVLLAVIAKGAEKL